jgi:single-stranded-DNA-specific exonuclease
MQKRWKILSTNDAVSKEIQQQLNVSRPIADVLAQRNISNFQSAKEYFRPQLLSLHDPFLMKDMNIAVERVLTAIDNKEKILVFGDYDVDGTTSVAVIYKFLRDVYNSELIDFYIPHRYREGYGVSKAGIDYASAHSFSLIIAVDCGIKSIDLVEYASALGVDFIICDHHLPDDMLPKAIAVLNPKQPGCNYPYKELCGCGIAFKLVSALSHAMGIDPDRYLCFLDLVVTAIAADIVPITGENRILSYYGLRKINSNPCCGLSALIKLSGHTGPLTINNIVFVIAPRVNAAGRMDDGSKAVRLFVEEVVEKAFAFAELLHSDNLDRRDADSSITDQALAMIEADEMMISRKSTVVFKADWHKGVVGIVASRLIERYYRPTVVLTQTDNVVAGSARSISGFNLYEAVHACREHLLGYGGHFAAAGLTLLPGSVDAFSKLFEKTVERLVTPEMLIPELVINAELPFSNITPNLYNVICQMEPFGPENMRPVFISRNVCDFGYSKIVKEQHIRFVLKQSNTTLTGIGFKLAEKFHLLENQQPVDIVYTLDENDWNGEKQLQLKVLDIRRHE